MLGFPGGRLDALWEIIQDGKIDLFLSEFILEELARNLRKKVKLPASDVAEILQVLAGHTETVDPKETVRVIHEKDADNRILECAVEAKAQVLVTGNFKHIVPLKSFRGIAILTPREFLDQYFPI